MRMSIGGIADINDVLVDGESVVKYVSKDLIREAIKEMEQMRDKDKIAEYPYNRCIRVLKEMIGDEC